MQLIRCGSPGNEKPGILAEDGTRLDVSSVVDDYDESFFAGDELETLQNAFKNNSLPKVYFSEHSRLGAPIARPSKILCIGLNYRDHARETGSAIPEEPVVFSKASTALCGAFDSLILPKDSTHTDWEVELAVVIGKRASYVTAEDALDHVAGYALMNDYSERSYQKDRGGQWVKGKSCDTFAPLGPFLVTRDALPGVAEARMWLSVNGVEKQNGCTSDMIFSVPQIISYLSEFMTLLPGDLISTGTPAGVGIGQNPAEFVKAGDTIRLGIEGLGESEQTAIAYTPC